MTGADLLHELTRLLRDAAVPDAAFEAKQLLLFVLRSDFADYLIHRSAPVTDEAVSLAFRLAERRVHGEPLQYILGEWDFLDETFFVGPGVLIPRPETESLVLQCEALMRSKRAPVILDLCAGSGCIGLSLQKRLPEAQVFLIEISDAALCYLQKNTDALGLASKVRILCGDVLRGPDSVGNLPQADLIVSNPPYIPQAELSGLQQEVHQEPQLALNGGADGLDFFRCFATMWSRKLNPEGCFAFECGEGQGALIASLFRPLGFASVIQHDFNGFDRFVFLSQRRKDLL